MERTWNNIGYKEVNEILSLQDKLKTSFHFKINLKRDDRFYGQIDQVFLSYLILLFKKNKKLIVEINFSDLIDGGRFFSFSDQVNQVKHLYNFINDENFIIKGSYAESKTGEIKQCINYKNLNQSSNFIPPILIYKFDNKTGDSITNFFLQKIKLSDNLTKKYYLKLIDQAKELVESSETTPNQKKIINELKKRAQNFSFIKLCLLRILIEKETNSIFKRKGAKSNIEIIKNLESFTNNLVIGLKELAQNVIDHSGSVGVISIRKYNKEVLKDLKARDENNYIDIANNENTIKFLDINIIDLGEKDIRTNYVRNLQDTQQSFLEIYKKENISGETDKQLLDNIQKSIKVSFNDDIKIISKKDFSFHKLFIKDNNNGINGLSVQRNKFISKIGLQYFTTIIKDVYEGFIKVSSFNTELSINEKAIIYYTSKSKEKHELKSSEDFINKGTFYNCIIPIKNWEKSLKKKSSKQYSIAQETNSFRELSNYNYIDKKESIIKNYKNDSKNIIDYKINFDDDTNETKYDDFYKLYKELSDTKEKNDIFSKENDIIAISCKELQNKSITNASHWVRFIWSLTNFFENIIFYDIDLIHFKEIRLLRENFHNDIIDFWDEDSRVLFYSKKEHFENNEYYRYGANILAGKKIEEFNYLNKIIWAHHYSFKGDYVFDLNENSSFKNSKHLKSALFSKNGGNLHYYEVLLKTSTPYEKSISLFEKSVQYSLNTLLVERQSSNTNNKGYKINNTHFKLGSKIHISDFYYAKKLFQNSFFTTPLAYQISESIWVSYFKNGEATLTSLNSFTIVGYENYSSFLVSSIRNFIFKRVKKRFPQVKINHLTIDKDGKLSRERHKLYENVLILIPIATSFNTSLKIEDQLNGIALRAQIDDELSFRKVKIIPPIQNIILVAHRSDDLDVFKSKNSLVGHNELVDTIYDHYNWKSIDTSNKLVTIERYNYSDSYDKDRIQKYLIPVYTKWEEAQNCNLCFPEDSPYSEKCLIETGLASITPQVIFSFPKTKPFFSTLNNNPTHLYLEGSLLYGNLKNKNNKYLYFNRMGKIIEDNNIKIKKWIENLRYEFFNRNEKFKRDFVNKKVVIVTPNTGSRSRFLDMINEFLFEYTANCIIISLKEDYIENSETLYSDGLHNADTVIYVDDVLSTANSFLESNYIIKYIRNKSQTGDGIDYCISLINRMSFSDEENLLLKLTPLKTNGANLNNYPQDIANSKERLIYCYKINNPTIEEANKVFPLELEREKYDFLEKNSSLDEIRKYFNSKRKNIQEYDLKESPPSQIKDYSLDFSRKKKKRNKKLFQALVLNALYSIFEYSFYSSSENKEKWLKNKSKYDREEWLELINKYFPNLEENFNLLKNESIVIDSITLLTEEVKSKLIKDIEHRHIIDENKNNIDFVILKIICSTPLIYYKQIRETSFYWVLIKLKKTIDSISKLENIIDIYRFNEKTNYSLYQDLKFLLKKSIKLRSNYIIHKETFNFFRCKIEKLNAITKEQRKKIKSEVNLNFKKELQRICKNKKYLSVPSLKLKLYDFIQNCLKDEIFQSIEFDNLTINIKGIVNTDLNSTKNYHKELIESYRTYRQKINKQEEHKLIEVIKPVVIKSHEKISKRFLKEFNNLLEIKRYKLSSTKKFITHIIALIQELVYQHETKSIKLDKVLSRFQNSSNGYNPNGNENGNFNHLLRLLQLENIEVINKYSNELIQPLTLEKLELSIPEKDKKYLVLKDLQNSDTNSLSAFLSLKKYINELTESESLDEKIQDIMSNILNKLKKIIGDDVEDIFFTINYKNFQQYKNDDIYTFSINDKFTNRIEIINDENSLTSLMGNEGFKEGENLFSHFEIIKKDNSLKCRDLKNVKDKIQFDNQVQYNDLGNNKSILLIRLSEFRKVKDNYKTFNTLGVITVYLDRFIRISEKKLKLLLALRHDLTEFIKKKTIGTTFLELLESKEQEKLIENSTHYLSKFHRSINKKIKIISNYNLFKEEVKLGLAKEKPITDFENELYLELNCVFAQINSIDKDRLNESINKNAEELTRLIELIFNSKIEKNIFEKSTYNIDIKSIGKENILFYYPVWYIIIPQIILNIKRYSYNKKNQIKIYSKGNFIYFENIINNNAVLQSKNNTSRKKQGIELCKKIIKDIYSINKEKIDDYILFKEIIVNKKNSHIVKLKIHE